MARHEASFLKLVKESEQLRSVTSVRLGAVRRRVQIRLCTEQRVREKKTYLDLFPRLDPCLILSVHMKFRPPRSVFNSLLPFFPFFSGSLCL